MYAVFRFVSFVVVSLSVLGAAYPRENAEKSVRTKTDSTFRQRTISVYEFENARDLAFEDASQGNADAQFRLGEMLLNHPFTGRHGDAIDWLMKAAKQNRGEAALLLGKEYEVGKNVAKDKKKALEYFRKSLKNGCAVAELHLGLAFFEGSGCEANPEKGLSMIVSCADSDDEQNQTIVKRALKYCLLTAELPYSKDPSKTLSERSKLHLNDRYGVKAGNDLLRARACGKYVWMAYLRLAWRHFESGDYAKAIEICEQICRDESRNIAEVRLLQGMCNLYSGERSKFFANAKVARELAKDGQEAFDFSNLLIEEVCALLEPLATSGFYTGDILDDELVFEARIKLAVDLSQAASKQLNEWFKRNAVTDAREQISCFHRRLMFEKIHHLFIDAFKFHTSRFGSFSAGERAGKVQSEFFVRWLSVALLVIGDAEHNRKHAIAIFEDINNYWHDRNLVNIQIHEDDNSEDIINLVIGAILEGCEAELDIALKGLEQAKICVKSCNQNSQARGLFDRSIYLTEKTRSLSLKTLSGEHVLKSFELLLLSKTFAECGWTMNEENRAKTEALEMKLAAFDLD